MPHTLAIDIGGTGLKASVLDESGALAVPGHRLPTPHPSDPKAVLATIGELARELPSFERISAGFPGVVQRGRVLTAPNLGTPDWAGFQLDKALAEKLGKPARVLNDADVQGLGVIAGKGLECVLTLGTGIGSSIFLDGGLCPHLELGQHPLHDEKTYDKYLGDAVLRKIGAKRWNKRVAWTLGVVHTLLNYDLLHLGGGNARKIDFKLPEKVVLASNQGGITGGVKLWDKALDRFFEQEAGVQSVSS